MPFYSASDRNADLFAAVIRSEPRFSASAPQLRRLLDAAASGATPELSESFIDLRKLSTRERWGEAATGKSERASHQVALMRSVGDRASIVRLLQQILADDFSGMRFAHGFDVSNATFAADVLLTDCAIEGAFRVDEARFYGALDISRASISGDLTAEQTQFVGPVALADVDVGRAARFGFSKLHSDLVFDRARIGRELWLRGSQVAGAVSGRDAFVERDAGLGNCTYGGPVFLDGSRFVDTVSFEGATFERLLSLDRCTFAGRVRLDGAKFAAGISTVGARFLGPVIPPLHEIVSAPSPQHQLVDRLRRAELP